MQWSTFVTPDDRFVHPDNRDHYVPVRNMVPKLMVIPLLWPFVAFFGFGVPLPYLLFYGGFLFVPPFMFCLLSYLMSRRPERYFIRFAILLEIVVAVVSITTAGRA
jgi:hypothetical protein